MGFMQLLACDGCGTRTAPGDVHWLELPEGWRIFTVKPLSDPLPTTDSRDPTVLCPVCWDAKSFAEVLG